jgi:FkbM family methyltransferase
MSYEMFESFSNYGEDSILNGIMKRLTQITGENFFEKSSYLDIGCYDPISGNNTYFLYKLGWNGTLVDANPSIRSRISDKRPRDIFENYAVSNDIGDITFYIFENNLQCNTTDYDFAQKISKSHNMPISAEIQIKSKRIDDIFEEHVKVFGVCPKVVNIDIEGKDYEVISEYSFKYRPLFIMMEDDILSVYSESKISKLLKDKGYLPVSNNFLTTIYMDKTTYCYSKLYNLGPIDLIDENHD